MCWWMMMAMIRCQEYLNDLTGYYIVMQIHDEMKTNARRERQNKASKGEQVIDHSEVSYLFNQSRLQTIPMKSSGRTYDHHTIAPPLGMYLGNQLILHTRLPQHRLARYKLE